MDDEKSEKTENSDKENIKSRYYRLKAAGICTNCGKRPSTQGVRCEECYQRGKAAQSRFDEKVKRGLRPKRRKKTVADWLTSGWDHGRSDLSNEVLRLSAKYPDMPPTAYGRMKAREYWEAQGVKTHDDRV